MYPDILAEITIVFQKPAWAALQLLDNAPAVSVLFSVAIALCLKNKSPKRSPPGLFPKPYHNETWEASSYAQICRFNH